MESNITDMIKEIFKINRIVNSGYFAEYYIYTSDSMDIPSHEDLFEKINSGEAWKNSNTLCFAELKNNKRAVEYLNKSNRFVYFIKKNRVHIDDKDIETWVELCIKNKMLPSYVKKESIKEKAIVLDISSSIKMNPSLLYIYLSSFRFISEDTNFVKATLIMTEKYKIPFLLSWVFASRAYIHNTGHSFADIGRISYLEDAEQFVKTASVPMVYLIGIKRYLKEPSKYDKRKIDDVCFFNAHSMIRAAGSGFNKSILLKDIKNEHLHKLFRTRSEKSENECIKNFYKSI